jgi:hypothetical protein
VSDVAKSGEERVYESVLLRRTYRDGSRVKHEALANLKPLPEAAIEAIKATLKGQRLVPVEQAVQIRRSLPHGHVAAVAAMARKLGLPALLGPAGRERDLVLALIISRVVLNRNGATNLAGSTRYLRASNILMIIVWERFGVVHIKVASRHR